jgi:hypothetical protein
MRYRFFLFVTSFFKHLSVGLAILSVVCVNLSVTFEYLSVCPIHYGRFINLYGTLSTAPSFLSTTMQNLSTTSAFLSTTMRNLSITFENLSTACEILSTTTSRYRSTIQYIAEESMLSTNNKIYQPKNKKTNGGESFLPPFPY